MREKGRKVLGVALSVCMTASMAYAVPAAAAETKTINLNEQACYLRTKGDIVEAFSQAVPQDYDAAFFAEEGSAHAPYKEFTMTDIAKENAVRVANYYRWLEGLSGFESASADAWSRAAKGSVLIERNIELTKELSHYPEKPADMDEAFYRDGYAATSSSNIAYGFGASQRALLGLTRGFLNDEGFTVPGHRNTFMTRNGVSFAAGYSKKCAVNTIIYTDDPNQQGESVVGNNNPAYAWPTPGYFPEEDISTKAVWTINLNTDAVRPASDTYTVTITDMGTGEKFVRNSTATGLFDSPYWGRYICFKSPDADSYSGKSYKVEVSDMVDAARNPVNFEYTVNFFSYEDEVEIDGATYTSDAYGRLTRTSAPAYLLGDVTGDGKVDVQDVTAMQRIIAEMNVPDERTIKAADIDKDGTVSVSDATLLQRYLAEFTVEL